MKIPNPVRSGPRIRLQIYLNDHRAGAAAGLAVGQRLAASNRGTELGTVVEVIVAEIEADARALDTIVEHFGLQPNPVKRTVALVAERLGRFKLNGQVTGYSPLSRLLEIEGLMAGIDLKRSLCASLRAVVAHERVGDIDLAELAERADSQRERLLPFHQAAAAQALAAGVLEASPPITTP